MILSTAMALDVIEGKIGMLELSPPVTFEPVGPVTTVFFDDKNQQVFQDRVRPNYDDQ